MRDTSDQLLGRAPEAPLDDGKLDTDSPRCKIAALLFAEPDHNQYPIRSAADGRRQTEVVNLLVAHCAMQERRPTSSTKWKRENELGSKQKGALAEESTHAKNDAGVSGRSDPKMGPLDYIFCAFKNQSSRKANYTFASKQSLIRHGDRCHFRHLRDGSERNCPDPTCSQKLWYTEDRLKLHVATVHGVEFFTRTQPLKVVELWD